MRLKCIDKVGFFPEILTPHVSLKTMGTNQEHCVCVRACVLVCVCVCVFAWSCLCVCVFVCVFVVSALDQVMNYRFRHIHNR